MTDVKRQPKIEMKDRLIFQLLFFLLSLLLPLSHLIHLQLFDYKQLLIVGIFWWLLQQLYFLFSQQEGVATITNMRSLALVEVLMWICILVEWQLKPGTLVISLICQWILVHTHIISHQLSASLAPVVYSFQVLLQQNLFEYASTNIIITKFSFFSWLYLLGILFIVSSALSRGSRHKMAILQPLCRGGIKYYRFLNRFIHRQTGRLGPSLPSPSRSRYWFRCLLYPPPVTKKLTKISPFLTGKWRDFFIFPILLNSYIFPRQ